MALSSVQQLISDSFIIIRDFISDEINEDPKKILGEKYWAILVEVNEVYQKEKSKCNTAIEKLDYYSSEIANAFMSFQCGECGSGLIEPTKNSGDAIESSFCCRSCGHSEDYEEIVSKAVSEYYAGEVYLSYTDGGDSPIIDCPECDGVYLYEEGICSSCGHIAEHTCQRCGSSIMPEELSCEPFCGYCAHMMSKDD